jgi:plastocyanin
MLKCVALVAVLGAVAVASPASATDVAKGPKVSITGDSDSTYAFSPGTVTVKKGGTVHWKWSSNAPHNVTFKKLGQASSDSENGSYKLKFNSSGTFKYECTIHDFKGKVVVN